MLKTVSSFFSFSFCVSHSSVKRTSWLPALFIEDGGTDDCFRHPVRIAVTRRPAIFKVSLIILGAVARNTDAGATMCHAGGERVDVGGFVESRQATFVVLPAMRVVHADVVLVSL